MSIQENKKLVRQVIEEWNSVNGDIIKMRSIYDKYYAPDFQCHNMSGGDMNRQETIQENASSVSAFPGVNYSIDDIIAEGDKTVARFTMQANHRGTFMGIPATGKLITVKGVEINKIVGGKIVETWDYFDTLGMLTQLGIIPGATLKR
jgi:steroid delta-isomerase-like uncharacterized protein